MYSRRPPLLHRLGALAVCLLVAACARPVGDFGRAQPGLLHDEVLPAAGTGRAIVAGEPVSRFNQTDDEREMHDRVWRFLVVPHAADWFRDTAVELQRVRIVAGPVHDRFDRASYYRWLSGSRYESSRIRFRTLAYHVQLDLDTLPGTFAAVCRVEEIDRRRATASHALGGLSARDQTARQHENAAALYRFVRALTYRYEAYAYALDHLLVETPHEEARNANARITSLAAWVDRAEHGRFCGEGVLKLGPAKGVQVPPRVQKKAPGEGPYAK